MSLVTTGNRRHGTCPIRQISLVFSYQKQKSLVFSYQKIIGMGPAVVPLILSELETEPDHWFWALEAITDENPVSESDAGDVEASARCVGPMGA